MINISWSFEKYIVISKGSKVVELHCFSSSVLCDSAPVTLQMTFTLLLQHDDVTMSVVDNSPVG